MSFAIPKPLLESLQSAFLAEGRRVCRDAAKILHRPEKEVLDILKTLPKANLVVHRVDTPTLCPVFLDNPSPLLQRCRRPCLLGTGRCFRHQDSCDPPSTPEDVIVLTRIKRVAEMDTPLWCCEETRQVYNEKGEIIGELTEGRELLVFTYQETNV